MSKVMARRLTDEDLACLGSECLEQVQCDQRQLCMSTGRRTPDCYVCHIPCTVRTPVLRAAIREVLDRITQTHFDDALRLEETVYSIDPMDSVPDASRQCESRALAGLWHPPFILLQDRTLDFEIACAVFAHACGHAAHRGECFVDRLESELPTEWFADANASYYAVRWGFSRQLEKAREQGTQLVTLSDLKREHKWLESCPTWHTSHWWFG